MELSSLLALVDMAAHPLYGYVKLMGWCLIVWPVLFVAIHGFRLLFNTKRPNVSKRWPRQEFLQSMQVWKDSVFYSMMGILFMWMTVSTDTRSDELSAWENAWVMLAGMGLILAIGWGFILTLNRRTSKATTTTN